MERKFSWNGISIERLDALVRLSRYESILAANGNDVVSANLMGRQIRELTEAVDVQLTKKEGRQTALNDKGHELARLASNFFDAVKSFQEDSGGNADRYVIGTGESIISKLLIPNFTKLRDLSHGARLVFKNRMSSDIVKGIKNGDLDIGLVSRNSCEGKRLETISLKSIGYSLFVPSAYKDQVPSKNPIKAISSIPLAMLEGGGELNSLMEQLAARNKIDLKPVFQGTSLDQVSQVVQSGECCGVLPSFFKATFISSEVSEFNLSSLKKLQREYVVAWKKGTEKFKPRIKTDIVEAIRKVFRES
jgi:DNA-binding transcriptional LysR family regulator